MPLVDELDEGEEGKGSFQLILEERNRNGKLLQGFWRRWTKEYLPLIAVRTKWQHPTTPLKVGDLVFICESAGWIRGVIHEVFMDPETQQVREAIVSSTTRSYRRPTTSIAKIWTQLEQIREKPTEMMETTREHQEYKGPMTRSRNKDVANSNGKSFCNFLLHVYMHKNCWTLENSITNLNGNLSYRNLSDMTH